MEIWKDIKGYENLYKINELGQVKSLSKRVGRGNGYMTKEIILKPALASNGYLSIGLLKNNIRKTKFIHSLMAQTFFNHKPSRYLVVDHIDNNKLNNRLTNLQIITQKENCIKDRKKSYSSKYVGVLWHERDNIWESSITIKGKQKYLGRFKTELEAHKAYQKALKLIINN